MRGISFYLVSKCLGMPTVAIGNAKKTFVNFDFKKMFFRAQTVSDKYQPLLYDEVYIFNSKMILIRQLGHGFSWKSYENCLPVKE